MEENKPVLFNAEAAQQAMIRREDASIARAVQEIQAALVIGQRNPRDEISAQIQITKACQRKSLAELAEYEYSRGGTRITGPTIDLLRAIANRWGNLLYGWDEVSRENGYSRIRCWAWDTQHNARAERTMIVRHWRDRSESSGGGYELTDERDIYENNANQAARRVRACLEEIIDGDVIEKAIDTCRETMRKGEKVPLKDRAIAMLNAFGEFAVTKEQVEARLGNSLDAISENQLASLRRVYRSLKDGVGKREDYFKLEVSKPVYSEPAPAAPSLPTQAPAPAPTPTPATPAPAVVPPPQKEEEDNLNFENATPAAAAPEPKAEEPKADPRPAAESNPLKLIRQACKTNKPVIREGVLLGFLHELGVTDGSSGTLEELQIASPAVVQTVIKQWPDLSAKLTAALKAGK